MNCCPQTICVEKYVSIFLDVASSINYARNLQIEYRRKTEAQPGQFVQLKSFLLNSSKPLISCISIGIIKIYVNKKIPFQISFHAYGSMCNLQHICVPSYRRMHTIHTIIGTCGLLHSLMHSRWIVFAQYSVIHKTPNTAHIAYHFVLS